jgi:hypothetical protein
MAFCLVIRAIDGGSALLIFVRQAQHELFQEASMPPTTTSTLGPTSGG